MVLDTLTPADRVNLLELYARSVMLLDLGRCEEWAELFEPRAFVRCGHQQFTGHDELVNLGRRMMVGDFYLGGGCATLPLRCRHLLSNVCLFGEVSRCASGYAHVTLISTAGGEPPRWLASGIYSDRLRRCASACWRFESRALTADALPTAKFGEAVAATRTHA
jgi:hypothetical protein